MKHYSIEKYIPLSVFFIVFLIYLKTVCPTVYLGDSGELTTAAFSLGIPHPSGYPIFALIGKLFCLIPMGSVAFRMNLMSAFFLSVAVLITYSIIYRLTSSVLSSIFGALILAFSQLFWLTTVSAEVYALHVFFVTLLIRLLIHWDEKRSLSSLSLFAFVVGLSFLNHLQTVMLAPAVLYFLIVSDRKGVLNLKTLTVISALFLLALTVYIYLPIRTYAGAVDHWGTPDTFKNFYNVVSGANHRAHYVFNKSLSGYILRAEEASVIVLKQFGAVILIALWGFIKIRESRWKIFYAGIILFDFFYTIFLNTVFIEITAFNLPTLIVISILSGIGINDILKKCNGIVTGNRNNIYRIAGIACCIVPVIFMISNYNVCDQSGNYIGYEHTLNTFRTINHGGTLFIDGDNNLFPIVYARFVERMRQDVTLYDKGDLFFKMPYPDGNRGKLKHDRDWNEVIGDLQKKIIQNEADRGVFFSVFNLYGIEMPENYRLIPYGTLSYVIKDKMKINQKRRISVWKYYATESLEGTFFRDYMNREVAAYYNFVRGRHLIMLGDVAPGLKRLKLASEIGYNDEIIYTELALFYTDYGYYDMAKKELKKALIYCDDLGIVYNDWGYYYSKKGDIDNAIKSIRKAVRIDPGKTIYYNNLGDMLLDAGQKDEAVEVFRKSLSINKNQEKIKEILRKYETGKTIGG